MPSRRTHSPMAMRSRLSCQARMTQADLVIEIPKYTINYEREGGGNK